MKRTLVLAASIALAGICADAASAFDFFPRAGGARPRAGATTPCVLDRCRDGAAPAAPTPTPVPPDAAADPSPDSAATQDAPPPRRHYGGPGSSSGVAGNFDFYTASV